MVGKGRTSLEKPSDKRYTDNEEVRDGRVPFQLITSRKPAVINTKYETVESYLLFY